MNRELDWLYVVTHLGCQEKTKSKLRQLTPAWGNLWEDPEKPTRGLAVRLQASVRSLVAPYAILVLDNVRSCGWCGADIRTWLSHGAG